MISALELAASPRYPQNSRKTATSFVQLLRAVACYLAKVPHAYRSDEEIVVAAVAENPAAMAFAICNRSLVLAAVTCQGLALQFVPQTYRDDPRIVLAAVRQEGGALQYASKNRLQDKAIVLAAVSQSGRSLQLAAPHLRDDRYVVLAAIAEDPLAIAHASTALKDDADVVLAATSQNWRAMKFASARLRGDRDFCFEGGQPRQADAEVFDAAIKCRQNGRTRWSRQI